MTQSGDKSDEKEKGGVGGNEEIIEVTQIANDEGPKEDCKNFYYGIGILSNPDSSIIEIYGGYPADEAGLKLGYKVFCLEPIRGDEIKDLDLIVERGDTKFNITVRRGKICLKN